MTNKRLRATDQKYRFLQYKIQTIDLATMEISRSLAIAYQKITDISKKRHITSAKVDSLRHYYKETVLSGDVMRVELVQSVMDSLEGERNNMKALDQLELIAQQEVVDIKSRFGKELVRKEKYSGLANEVELSFSRKVEKVRQASSLESYLLTKRARG